MGSVVSSCKRNKKKDDFNASNQTNYPPKTKPKPFILGKNRKIIQKDKELYQVVFEAEGFSVHDLALLGQKNSPETVIRQDLVPREMGRVHLFTDVTDMITKKKKKGKMKAITPLFGKSPSPKSPNSPTQNQETLVLSNGDFEIVEIQDWVDDLYLQLLEPAMESEEKKDSNTTNTDNNNTNKGNE